MLDSSACLVVGVQVHSVRYSVDSSGGQEGNIRIRLVIVGFISLSSSVAPLTHGHLGSARLSRGWLGSGWSPGFISRGPFFKRWEVQGGRARSALGGSGPWDREALGIHRGHSVGEQSGSSSVAIRGIQSGPLCCGAPWTPGTGRTLVYGPGEE